MQKSHSAFDPGGASHLFSAATALPEPSAPGGEHEAMGAGGLSGAEGEGCLEAVGSSPAWLLRSESHFHVMGAVHTL